MRVIAIANQKGGVGKTTTATNLAAGLAFRGYLTLLVDLDSQCNATFTYLAPELIETTLANVLVGHDRRIPMIDAIYETHIPKLDIAPSHIRLAMIERQVQIEDQYRLKDSLDSVTEYEFAIIDSPPSLGMTLTQALLASTHAIVTRINSPGQSVRCGQCDRPGQLDSPGHHRRSAPATGRPCQ